MKFSERKGIVTKTLQTDRVDKALRNKLWNLFVKTAEIKRKYKDITQERVIMRGRILRLIWSEGLNKLIDEFPKEPWLIADYPITGILTMGADEKQAFTSGLVKMASDYEELLDDVQDKIKDYFFECKWHEIYDFFEFLLNRLKIFKDESIIKKVNKILVEEKSGWYCSA